MMFCDTDGSDDVSMQVRSKLSLEKTFVLTQDAWIVFRQTGSFVYPTLARDEMGSKSSFFVCQTWGCARFQRNKNKHLKL